MVVHRLLHEYEKGIKPNRISDLKKQLPGICEQCSKRERTAVEAERESVKIKQVEYAAQHIGDTFEGLISGVTGFGIFVELTQLLVEGLVRLVDIEDDYYVFYEERFALIGERTNKMFRLGDQVTVQIINASTERKTIELKIVQPES